MKKKHLLLAGILPIVVVFFNVRSFSDEIGFTKCGHFLEDKMVQDTIRKEPFIKISESAPKRLKPATIGMTFNATPEQTWKIITDYENYDKIFFSVGKMKFEPKILEKRKNGATVRFKTELVDFTLIRVHIDCIQQVTFDNASHKMNVSWNNARVIVSPKRIPRWIFIQFVPWGEGKIKDASGVFEFIPVDGGKRTAVFCAAAADFRDTVVGARTFLEKFPEIEPMITLGGLRIIMGAIKREAEKSNQPI